ncbi:MAG: YfcE family phosphodiesterase [Ramlibacter sp.]|jgi:putative phosphoesterase|uniref:metallophosphoesterase family protein n=1 Tax=Ramlibacter sp. TaxID=1917967 RepID=UPI002619B440|nr:metallophosphoesterase family protein [Ramlibacter sp.]MDB5752360.1 YfcE family phosphodiesterase [Ramlibacter sp.]
MLRIGLISDTHGLLRPQVLAFLRGSDHILHAGDICEPAVLAQLRTLAPVTAVRGNNDLGPWAQELQETETVVFGAVRIHMVHDLAELGRGWQATGVQAVVSGHSHRPRVEQRNGVLWINPGSAGPRRFKLPISAGELLVDGASVSARLVEF